MPRKTKCKITQVGKCESSGVLKSTFNNYVAVPNYCWILLDLKQNSKRMSDFITGI